MTALLSGRCMVLTRPLGQGQELADMLAKLGSEVLDFPVTQIVSLADPTSLRALTQRLPEFSIAFFVSANAVQHCFAQIARNDWPAQLAVATVGPATAKSLYSNGFAHVIVPEDDFDSEGVLALPEFQAAAVSGRQVLVLRGEGGRELLADTLRERGAVVEQISCYQRQCASLDPSPLWTKAANLSGIVFSSSEAIRHFVTILGPRSEALLAELPVFAPHPRILDQARDCGARQPVLTGAGDEGIVSGIIKHFEMVKG